MRHRWVAAIAFLLVFAGIGGCASIPASSPVQVLREVTAGDDVLPPPGPVDGSNPLDLVRDFVTASGSSTDRHGAARRYLTPEAQAWDDAASLVILDGQIDTVPAPDAQNRGDDVATIRIRGTAVGRITAEGSFEPAQATFQRDVELVRRDGQWRISRLPDGVVVPLSIFRENYRTVRIWFVDPVRRLAVADLRYVPSVPARAQTSRVMELLLAGPSGALSGAAITALAPGARLRSNVAASPDGALVVDLTRAGDLDDPARLLLAAQVVLSLAEVNGAPVRLLLDGEPLIPGRTDLTRDDVAGQAAEMVPGADVPALVVAGGRVARLSAPGPAAPLPGPAGDGTAGAVSAASSVDGQRLAVVGTAGRGQTLLVGGPDGSGLAPVALDAQTMTRPSWTPTGNEVWTVLDSSVVARVVIGDAAARTDQVNAGELAALGPIRDLRLSRDGMRVVAVVGRSLFSAAVVRNLDGEVAVRNVRVLRPADLGEVVAADWRSSESVVVVSQGAGLIVAQVSVDGLAIQRVLGNNLTPPLTAIAASPNRPLLVTDQGGVWSFAGGEQDAWRQVLAGSPGAVPLYPG